jgi:16S rRNA (adenine1518-N6/adenine1519-N6)-dimethyltransferase
VSRAGDRAGVPAAPHRARKRFGQHFLEPAWVAKLVAAIDPRPDDVLLEIGPGRGALTAGLAPRVARIVAIEIDRDLAAALPRVVPASVRVVEGDVLGTDLAALLAGEPAPVRVAGNLPYNVATPILFRLLHASGGGRVLSDATVMLQKEVADRVVARPGSGDYGSLAIHVALDADAEAVLVLPPGAFRPPPKVTSAVVRLRFRPPAVDVGDRDVFERLVRGVFQQRRKTLLNALRPVADTFGRHAADLLDRAGVDPKIRPGDLALEGFAALSRAVL